MEIKPTPEQLERARQISADIVAKVDCPLRGKYLDGRCDHSHAVKAALAAILQSDQQQAELKTLAEAMAGALAKIKGMDSYIEAPSNRERTTEMGPFARATEPSLTAFREFQGGRSDG